MISHKVFRAIKEVFFKKKNKQFKCFIFYYKNTSVKIETCYSEKHSKMYRN